MNTDSQFPNSELQNKEAQEPTVLDLYKSVTRDWSSFFYFLRTLWDARRREELNRTLAVEVALAIVEEKPEEPVRVAYFPWRSALALFLALAAQFLLESTDGQANIGAALYIFAIGFVIWAYIRDEWHLPALPVFMQMPEPLSTRIVPFFLSIIFAGLAFWKFGGGKFTPANLTFWMLALIFLVYGFWLKNPKTARESNAEDRVKKNNLERGRCRRIGHHTFLPPLPHRHHSGGTVQRSC